VESPIRAGQIVVLNGPPRSGKSSIVRVIQDSFDGVWVNLGVDVFARHVTPQRYQPGIGLRPGGERPDIEAVVPALYAALYESIAAHSRQGLNVVADVDHHDAYSRSPQVLRDVAARLAGLPALFVGVRCPVEVIMRRRRETWGQPWEDGAAIPGPVLRWQEAVHDPGIYDLEVDTGQLSPTECGTAIARRLQEHPAPSAFARLAEAS